MSEQEFQLFQFTPTQRRTHPGMVADKTERPGIVIKVNFRADRGIVHSSPADKLEKSRAVEEMEGLSSRVQELIAPLNGLYRKILVGDEKNEPWEKASVDFGRDILRFRRQTENAVWYVAYEEDKAQVLQRVLRPKSDNEEMVRVQRLVALPYLTEYQEGEASADELVGFSLVINAERVRGHEKIEAGAEGLIKDFLQTDFRSSKYRLA